MAGGPNAAIVMCMRCGGKANRISKGCETDYYLCEECGSEYGIDWGHGPPDKPCWPPSLEDREAVKNLAARRASHQTSGERQSPASASSPRKHRWWQFWKWGADAPNHADHGGICRRKLRRSNSRRSRWAVIRYRKQRLRVARCMNPHQGVRPLTFVVGHKVLGRPLRRALIMWEASGTSGCLSALNEIRFTT